MNPIPQYLLTAFDASYANVLWGSALFLVAVFIIYSLFLLYHWLRYGEKRPAIRFCMFLYFGVSFMLFGSLFIALSNIAF